MLYVCIEAFVNNACACELIIFSLTDYGRILIVYIDDLYIGIYILYTSLSNFFRLVIENIYYFRALVNVFPRLSRIILLEIDFLYIIKSRVKYIVPTTQSSKEYHIKNILYMTIVFEKLSN